MTIIQALESCDDALEILKAVLNVESSFLMLNKTKELSKTEEARFKSFVEKRKDGTPLAYVINRRGFWRDYFFVNENVLIPQPDTELLVEKAFESLSKIDKKNIRILDLCAGSGCIGISLANELANNGKVLELTLSDISPKAFEVFSKNADSLVNKNVSVTKVVGDLFQPLSNQKFDCIVTNPPYIETSVISSLPQEVQMEPHLALDGGKDGLDLIRKIAGQCKEYLNDFGLIFCEIGYNQGKEAVSIFQKVSSNVELFQDLGMCDRVVKASF